MVNLGNVRSKWWLERFYDSLILAMESVSQKELDFITEQIKTPARTLGIVESGSKLMPGARMNADDCGSVRQSSGGICTVDFHSFHDTN